MINNRNYYISELYEAYPILAQIDKNNDGILSKRATFKELLSDEYLTTHEGECIGFLFVLSGNIKVQKIELSTESSSKDLQTIETTLAVNYRINSDKATHLYRTVGNNYESTILEPAIKESIKATIAKYTAAEVITERANVSKNCMEDLQSKIDKYGITIDNFNITNLSFSEEYSKAIEDKQVAEQKLEKAKLDAESKLVEAQATKKANDLLKQSLTDNLIAKEFINKWDGKLPSSYAGKDILSIFNLK